ncbi:hypothetical protein ACNF5F_27810, partial [Escherichia coli]|uniref:hypothetical protein n=1 Tax=Escherichia coli TaxID=562 RepID=UPI003BA0A1D4
MTGETAAAVEGRPSTLDTGTDTRIPQGTPAFRRTALALFLAGSLSHQVLLPRWQAWMARAPRLPEVGTGLLLLYVLAH